MRLSGCEFPLQMTSQGHADFATVAYITPPFAWLYSKIVACGLCTLHSAVYTLLKLECTFY